MATLSPKVTVSKGLQLAGDPQAEWRYITPDIAGEWLKLNTLNRPKKLQKIALYAADMNGGHWPVTGATISFGMILTAILTFFVALGTITVLMKLVRHVSFLPFAIYRVALGVVLLALIYSGMPLGAVN